MQSEGSFNYKKRLMIPKWFMKQLFGREDWTVWNNCLVSTDFGEEVVSVRLRCKECGHEFFSTLNQGPIYCRKCKLKKLEWIY